VPGVLLSPSVCQYLIASHGQMELNRHNMRAAIKDFQLHPSDTVRLSGRICLPFALLLLVKPRRHCTTHG
jgi:hypothetical protein